MREIEIKKNANKIMLLSAFLSMAACISLFLLGTDFLYITIIALLALFAPFLLLYLLNSYLKERLLLQKERLVPDLLLQASVFPPGTPVEKIIAYMGKQNFAALSKEFERAKEEIKKGSTVAAALQGIKQRNNSRVIDRAIDLLIQGYNSGADMSKIFRETASDLLETNAILRERNATLIVEKYTLLFAGGLIVPAVLGLLASMVVGMDFTAMEHLDFGIAAEERENILNMSMAANQIYIAEYAIIASLYIANQENEIRKSLLYGVLLLPLSFFVYNAARLLWI